MVMTGGSAPIPATIGTFFGGMWALIAAFALPSEWRPIAIVVALFATVLLICRLWFDGTLRQKSAERLFSRKPYQIAVTAELAAIYAASVALARLGLEAYLIQTVGFIVGLHFIGLWIAAKSLRFLAISGGMCLVSGLAMLLPNSGYQLDWRDFVTGAGNAFILWIGASRGLMASQ